MSIDNINHLRMLGDQAFIQNDYREALQFYLSAGKNVVNMLWNIQTGQKVRSLYAYDINGDRMDEVIIGSEDCKIYVVSDEGKEIWNYKTGGWVMGVGAIDIDQDNCVEVIAGSDKVYIFDNFGNIKSTFDTPDSVSSLWVGVIKGNIGPVLLTGHDNGTVNVWNANGVLIWRYKTPRRVICLLADDINGDGKSEVVIGSEDHRVYIIDENGNLLDIFQVNHWIFNVDTCDIGEERLRRLFIGVFEGDVHIYKHYKEHDSRTLRVKQHGILSLAVERLLPNQEEPQIIIGSSDRNVSVVDLHGNLLWRFEVGYGHRVLIAKAIPGEDPTVKIIVGAELGGAYAYNIRLIPGLVDSIHKTFELLGIRSLIALNLPIELGNLLRTFVALDPIVHEANITNLRLAIQRSQLEDAIFLGMELWWNKLEFRWSYETGGRIYALSASDLKKDGHVAILVGSEDGNLHALDANDGHMLWKFQAKGGIRGVSADYFDNVSTLAEIAIASVDGNVYLLDHKGFPMWNFQTEKWGLYTFIKDVDNDIEKEVIVGSDDYGIYAFRRTGQLMWRFGTNDRVRALTANDIDNDGFSEIIAGSDDRWVYILDQHGHLKHKFETPHWILVIHTDDIDQDGKFEILLGTEDGHLYVYDFFGVLKWKFRTEHWIAALGTYYNPIKSRKEIAIGSADRFIYGVDSNGYLLWLFETGARVRTLLPVALDDNNQIEIFFGSYDQSVYRLSLYRPEILDELLSEIRSLVVKSIPGSWTSMLSSDKDSLRAFACLNILEKDLLLRATDDDAPMVRASAGYSLITSQYFADPVVINTISHLLCDNNGKVRTSIHSILSGLDSTKREAVVAYLRNTSEIVASPEARIQKIQCARKWMADQPSILLSLLAEMVSQSDPWLIDEIRRSCEFILSKPNKGKPEITIDSTAIDRLYEMLKPITPSVADRLRKL